VARYHVPEVDPATIIDRIAHRGEAAPLKQALAEAVAALVASPAIRDAVPEPLTPDWQAELTVLATMATRLRTPVLHGPDLATSQYAPADESVGRLFGVLDSLRLALAMLGVDGTTAWTLLRRVAFDSVDARRMRVVRGLLWQDGQRTSDLAALVSFPTSMAGAILDELAHRGVVSRDHGQGSAAWTLDGDVAKTGGAMGRRGRSADPPPSCHWLDHGQPASRPRPPLARRVEGVPDGCETA
jgi:hypothetical protein